MIKSEFNELPWHKKIHEDIEIEEVEGTLRMIEELYKSIEANRTQNNS